MLLPYLSAHPWLRLLKVGIVLFKYMFRIKVTPCSNITIQSYATMANPPSSPKFDWKMFRYIPTLIGAIISLIIFLILALLHLWQLLRLRQGIVVYVIIGTLCTSMFSHVLTMLQY
jgi:hypothetical protein